MPTILPRVQITETADVREALELGCAQWPQAKRSEVASRLIKAGAKQLSVERSQAAQLRQVALAETAGLFVGVYPPDYLAKLRADWPQ